MMPVRKDSSLHSANGCSGELHQLVNWFVNDTPNASKAAAALDTGREPKLTPGFSWKPSSGFPGDKWEPDSNDPVSGQKVTACWASAGRNPTIRLSAR